MSSIVLTRVELTNEILDSLPDVTVTTSAARIAANLGTLKGGPTGILLQAPKANTVPIRIGKEGKVGATQGIQLDAGQSIIVSVDDAYRIFAIAESSGTSTLIAVQV